MALPETPRARPKIPDRDAESRQRCRRRGWSPASTNEVLDYGRTNSSLYTRGGWEEISRVQRRRRSKKMTPPKLAWKTNSEPDLQLSSRRVPITSTIWNSALDTSGIYARRVASEVTSGLP